MCGCRWIVVFLLALISPVISAQTINTGVASTYGTVTTLNPTNVTDAFAVYPDQFNWREHVMLRFGSNTYFRRHDSSGVLINRGYAYYPKSLIVRGNTALVVSRSLFDIQETAGFPLFTVIDLDTLQILHQELLATTETLRVTGGTISESGDCYVAYRAGNAPAKVAKFSRAAGAVEWTIPVGVQQINSTTIGDLTTDPAGNPIIFYAKLGPTAYMPTLLRLSSFNGAQLQEQTLSHFGNNQGVAEALTTDSASNLYATFRQGHITTQKLDSNFQQLWTVAVGNSVVDILDVQLSANNVNVLYGTGSDLMFAAFSKASGAVLSLMDTTFDSLGNFAKSRLSVSENGSVYIAAGNSPTLPSGLVKVHPTLASIYAGDASTSQIQRNADQPEFYVNLGPEAKFARYSNGNAQTFPIPTQLNLARPLQHLATAPASDSFWISNNSIVKIHTTGQIDWESPHIGQPAFIGFDQYNRQLITREGQHVRYRAFYDGAITKSFSLQTFITDAKLLKNGNLALLEVPGNGQATKITILDPSTGTTVRQLVMPSVVYADSEISADGHMIITGVSGISTTPVYVVDLDTQYRVVSIPHGQANSNIFGIDKQGIAYLLVVSSGNRKYYRINCNTGEAILGSSQSGNIVNRVFMGHNSELFQITSESSALQSRAWPVKLERLDPLTFQSVWADEVWLPAGFTPNTSSPVISGVIPLIGTLSTQPQNSDTRYHGWVNIETGGVTLQQFSSFPIFSQASAFGGVLSITSRDLGQSLTQVKRFSMDFDKKVDRLFQRVGQFSGTVENLHEDDDNFVVLTSERGVAELDVEVDLDESYYYLLHSDIILKADIPDIIMRVRSTNMNTGQTSLSSPIYLSTEESLQYFGNTVSIARHQGLYGPVRNTLVFSNLPNLAKRPFTVSIEKLSYRATTQ